MFKDDIHKLLCVFTMMVVADKRIYAVEIDAFTKSGIQFFEKTTSGPVPSQARLLMWFEMNREYVKSKVTQNNFEAWFEGLIDDVSQNYSIKAVIDVMQAIAEADEEVHISEKALLVLVKKYWQRAA